MTEIVAMLVIEFQAYGHEMMEKSVMICIFTEMQECLIYIKMQIQMSGILQKSCSIKVETRLIYFLDFIFVTQVNLI